jgi:RNA polymerase sporulation-specific sigma factor
LIEILFSAIFDVLSNLFLMLGYVSNVNSFPQPLRPEEEQHYVEAYKNGSEEARNILIERNLRLVAHIVKKYGSCGNDSDDLISIGTIGLIKAISTFNMDKGTRLATYAARCIENAILSLGQQYQLLYIILSLIRILHVKFREYLITDFKKIRTGSIAFPC